MSDETKPVICIGEPTIAKLRNREVVELSDAILIHASDLATHPSPQGEEETAAEAVIMRIESNARRGLNIAETRALIAGYRALRQRADEATRAENEACAKIAGDFSAANYAAKPFTSYAEGRADAGAAIEAAICARIAPT